MNVLAFAATTYCPLPLPGFDISRGEDSEYPALLSPVEQAEVDEALALSDLGVTCFNCCFGASFERSGQFWCSVACWIDVMNGGCDYWYGGGQDGEGQVGAANE